MGTVRKRTWINKDGTKGFAWVATIRSNGVPSSKAFAKKGEAEAYLEREAPLVRAGVHVPDAKSITVAQAAEEWIETKRLAGAEASTLRQYDLHARRYIVPRLGGLKLTQLNKPTIHGFRDHLRSVASPAMAKKIMTSLNGILNTSVERGRVGGNVAKGVTVVIGKRDKKRVTIPTRAQLGAVLDELSARAETSPAWHRWRALIATAALTGLRASELRGLEWSAVDLKRGELHVTQRADENGEIGPPKTETSGRTIKLSSDLASLLREWKMRQERGRVLVFGNGADKPENLANIFNRAWVPLKKATGVKFNFHALRHFFASMLIADGANPKEVQVAMGHSSIKISFDIYGHLMTDEDADRARVERAERLSAGFKLGVTKRDKIGA